MMVMNWSIIDHSGSCRLTVSQDNWVGRYLKDDNNAPHNRRESELDFHLRSTVKMRRSKYCYCPIIHLSCLLSDDSLSDEYYLERMDQRHWIVNWSENHCKFRRSLNSTAVSPRIIRADFKELMCDIYDEIDSQLTEHIDPYRI